MHLHEFQEQKTMIPPPEKSFASDELSSEIADGSRPFQCTSSSSGCRSKTCPWTHAR